jgi:hypothetical protein
MAQTQRLAVTDAWALVPGTAATVTISPDDGVIHMRIATTNSAVTPPAVNIEGHPVPLMGERYQRGAGESLWVRASSFSDGMSISFTEGV